LYAAISGVGLDALSEARHPDVAHDVAEAGALDVAAEVPGVLLHAGAPVVLDLVVRAPGEVLRDLGPAVAPARVQVQDQQQLLRGDVAPPHVGPQVVEPPEAAALARALEARGAGERVPAALAVGGDVVHEQDVLVHRPGAPPEVGGGGGGLVVFATAATCGGWCCGGGRSGGRRRAAGAHGQHHLVQVLQARHQGHGHVHVVHACQWWIG